MKGSGKYAVIIFIYKPWNVDPIPMTQHSCQLLPYVQVTQKLQNARAKHSWSTHALVGCHPTPSHAGQAVVSEKSRLDVAS